MEGISQAVVVEQKVPDSFYSQFVNRHGCSFVFNPKEKSLLFFGNEKSNNSLFGLLNGVRYVDLSFVGLKNLFNCSFSSANYTAIIRLLREVKSDCGKCAGFVDATMCLEGRIPSRLLFKFRPMQLNPNDDECVWIIEMDELCCDVNNVGTVLVFRIDYQQGLLFAYESDWFGVYNQCKPLLSEEKMQMLQLMKMAKSKREMAEIMKMSEAKIKYHINRMHELFHFKTNNSLSLYFSFVGLL